MREAATICPRPCDLESGVQVTCDMGYLCANFSLSRPLCSRLRPDVRVTTLHTKSNSLTFPVGLATFHRYGLSTVVSFFHINYNRPVTLYIHT